MVEQASKLFAKGNTIHLDLANDLYIRLGKYTPERLNELITTNQMHTYIRTALSLERRGTDTRFSRVYKRERNYDDIPDTETTHNGFSENNMLDDFEKAMLALYATYGDYDTAARKARMGKRTLIRYINAIKKKLNNT